MPTFNEIYNKHLKESDMRPIKDVTVAEAWEQTKASSPMMTVELTHPEVCEALRKYARDNGISVNQAVEETLYFFLVAKV